MLKRWTSERVLPRRPHRCRLPPMDLTRRLLLRVSLPWSRFRKTCSCPLWLPPKRSRSLFRRLELRLLVEKWVGNVAGLVANLTRLQVQEQVANSSGAPPGYEGRIELDPILSLGARVGLLSQQTVSKSQVNGKQTQPITYLASSKQIYNLLSSVSAWFVCSLLGHVTTVSPWGKPWKNWQFIKQIYLQFTEPFVQSVFFQFAEWFNHSLLDSVNQKKTKLVYWRCPWLVNLKNTWNFYRTCHWW